MFSHNGGAVPPNSLRPDTPFPAHNQRSTRLIQQEPSKGSPLTNELLVAARKGYSKELERLLMEKGTIATTIVDRHGRNCLHLACHYGHISTVSVILRIELFDINVTSKKGFTPLHEASSEGHVDIVLLLLAMGAFSKARSKEGWTALMSACYNGHLDVVKILIAIGIDVNATNVHGFTALHVAAWRGNTGIVELLIKEGALLAKETQNGKVALDIAKEERQHEVVTVLQAASVRESEKPFYRIAALEGQIHMLQEKLKTAHSQQEEILAKEKAKFDKDYTQLKQELMSELSQAKDEIERLKKTIETLKSRDNNKNSQTTISSNEQMDKSQSTPTVTVQQLSPPKKKKQQNGVGNTSLQTVHRGSDTIVYSSSPFMSQGNGGNRKRNEVQETMDILGLDSTNSSFETSGKSLLADSVTPRRSLDGGMRGNTVSSRPNDKLTITQLVEDNFHKPGSMAAIRLQLKADGLTPKINKKFREFPSMPENLSKPTTTTLRPPSPFETNEKNTFQD